MTKIRFRYKLQHIHVQVRMFSGTGDNVASCGSFMMRIEEWNALCEVLNLWRIAGSKDIVVETVREDG